MYPCGGNGFFSAEQEDKSAVNKAIGNIVLYNFLFIFVDKKLFKFYKQDAFNTCQYVNAWNDHTYMS